MSVTGRKTFFVHIATDHKKVNFQCYDDQKLLINVIES